MLLTLPRILPKPVARSFVGLVAWISAAALLQGVALGLIGSTVAALLTVGADPALWIVVLVLTVVAFLIVQWIAQMFAFRNGNRVARALHLMLGEHIVRLPLGWSTPSRRADLIDAATTGVPQLMSYPALLLRPAITAVVTPISAAATLALLDWRYSLATMAMTFLAWGTSRLSRRLAAIVDTRRHHTQAEATDRILEFASNQPVIRTDQRPDDDALKRALSAAARASRRSAATVLPGMVSFSLTVNVLFAALIASGVFWVSEASMTVPAFVGVLVVTFRLTSIAASGAELAAGMRLQQGSLNRIRAVLTVQPLPIMELPYEQCAYDGVLVEANSISFGYGHDQVLHDIEFTLPRRGLIAMVGPSGSGKTTIARLLARFWDPATGRIVIDGHDIRALEPDELYLNIGMVLQEDVLKDGTIGENIRLGRPEASAAELERVVNTAGLKSLMQELPDGLESPTGPRGSRLSGGQRQRISVARALLKAAPLTIMDEPTAALDPENSRITCNAAYELACERSVLIIAHNLNTVVQADQILVVEGGRIIQHGSHSELSSRPGKYLQLLEDYAGGCEQAPNRRE